MAQKGTIEIKTENNGVKQIPVFDPGDVTKPIVRVKTETGEAALNLKNPSNAELDQLRIQTENNGVLAVSTSTPVSTATADATLNSQSATLHVFEDTSGDGSADNVETVTVQDGSNTYKLSNITGGTGNTYWIEAELSNTNIEKTPEINSISLTV